MGQKRIVISECIFEDLIYGRLRGPVNSDAPKRMKIIGVHSETGKHSSRNTGNVCVYVEHPDFKEIGRHQYPPILEVIFTQDVDLATQELIVKLRRIAEFLEEDGQIALNIACETLMTDDARYNQLFEDNTRFRRHNDQLQIKLDTIVNMIKAG
jgi:hypothetical protein